MSAHYNEHGHGTVLSIDCHKHSEIIGEKSPDPQIVHGAWTPDVGDVCTSHSLERLVQHILGHC